MCVCVCAIFECACDGISVFGITVCEMGGSASKKVEERLEGSPLFQAAVYTSFQECLAFSQHSVPGVLLYQLLHASHRIYHLLPTAHHQDDEDPASLIKHKWLPSLPSQSDVDHTLRQGGFALAGKQYLTLEEFREFASRLFCNMAVATAERRLALYVPVGSIALLVTHLAAKRLPVLGPAYRSAGLLTPGLLLGSVLGAVAALGFGFP